MVIRAMDLFHVAIALEAAAEALLSFDDDQIKLRRGCRACSEESRLQGALSAETKTKTERVSERVVKGPVLGNWCLRLTREPLGLTSACHLPECALTRLHDSTILWE